ncbi:MAG: hypothetical protein JSS51_15460 [Planctomycetes bacterium]|nr:hypothetical protein [Planctomycetota bacterium]
MTGTPDRQAAVYHTFNVEDLIEPGRPLRAIKRMVEWAKRFRHPFGVRGLGGRWSRG